MSEISNGQCTFMGGLTQPLYSSTQNTINPCFISSSALAINIITTALGAYQHLHILYRNKYGPFRIHEPHGSPFRASSVGRQHLCKLMAILLQALILLVFVRDAAGINSTSVAFTWISTVVVFLPLQVNEPLRSVVPLASTLLFWSSNLIINTAIFFQNTFSEQPVWVQQTASHQRSIYTGLQVLLIMNTGYIFVSQFVFYSGSRELLEFWDTNEWNVHAVHDFFSRLCFFYFNSYISHAHTGTNVTIDDVPDITLDLAAEEASKEFDYYWDQQVKKALARNRKPSLYPVFFRIHGLTICTVFILDFLATGAVYLQTKLLGSLLEYFSSSDGTLPGPKVKAYLLSVGLFLMILVKSFLSNYIKELQFTIDQKIRVALTDKLFKKALNLSSSSRSEKGPGDIINHLSMDTYMVAESGTFSAQLILYPPKVVICLIGLYGLFGKSIWMAVASALVVVPGVIKASYTLAEMTRRLLNASDKRLRVISEVVSAIKSVKLFGWEQPMMEKIARIRNQEELVWLRKLSLNSIYSVLIVTCAPIILICVSYLGWILFESAPLTPVIIFPAAQFFSLIDTSMTEFQIYLAESISIHVSIKRLAEFFMMDEFQETVTRSSSSAKNGQVAVEVKDVTFTYSKNSINVALERINFAAKAGEVTCIIGQSGCGKTNLLQALLGQLPFNSSDQSFVKVKGSVAYCAQDPWLTNATIKENILFGHRYDPQFYWRTVQACQLASDFDNLPDGELTFVGDKGTTLSGGQKARIALARAVYARCDVYLLDEVLTALDSHACKKIIKEVFGSKGILASRTIILATNVLSVLDISNSIFLLDQGKIIEHEVDQSRQPGTKITELLNNYVDNFEEQKPKEIIQLESIGDKYANQNLLTNEAIAEMTIGFSHGVETSELTAVLSRTSIGQASMESYEQGKREQKTAIQEEHKEGGSVKMSVYHQYFKAGHYGPFIFYVVSYVLFIYLVMKRGLFLASWAEKNLRTDSNNSPIEFLIEFFMFGITNQIVFGVSVTVLFMSCSLNASTYLHDKMIEKVVKSPMGFFTQTPFGRIINRFSDDLNSLDRLMAANLVAVTGSISLTIASFTVIIFSMPVITFAILILMWFYNNFKNYFLDSSRELRRLSVRAKSPVFSLFQESYRGSTTIRSFGRGKTLFSENSRNADDYAKLTFMNNLCNLWLSLRLKIIGSCISFSVALTATALAGTSRGISPGILGFLLTNSFEINEYLSTIVNSMTTLENKAISIERIIEFANLDTEDFDQHESQQMLSANPLASHSYHWVKKGDIQFKKYGAKYRKDLEPVLKNINVCISAGEKIGVVGRTGAGKSSLALALFKMVEKYEGTIEVDGIDIDSLGLTTLRRGLNIIPQESIIIEGTLKENLDPCDEYTSEQIWKALGIAGLKNAIEEFNELAGLDPNSLELPLTDSNSSLSLGQRQLLSLSRALLNPSKILVLDEATSAIDTQTDKIVQSTIREAFKNKTVITIAHRLDSIIDNDKVLVLDQGEVVEFDTPKNLLSNKSSVFRLLCEDGKFLAGLDISTLK